MSIRHFNRVIQTVTGDIVTGVVASVFLSGTATLASLFSDVAGAIPMANPLTNNATYGTVDFYVEEGTYDLTFAKAGYTFQSLLNWTIGAPLLRNIVTVNTINGAAILSATGAIPAGARVHDVFAHNNSAFGSSGGMTAYNIGDGVTVDMWGVNQLAQNAENSQAGFHSGDLPIYAVATDVVLSAIGGLFDGSGQAQVEVVYELNTPI